MVPLTRKGSWEATIAKSLETSLSRANPCNSLLETLSSLGLTSLSSGFPPHFTHCSFPVWWRVPPPSELLGIHWVLLYLFPHALWTVSILPLVFGHHLSLDVLQTSISGSGLCLHSQSVYPAFCISTCPTQNSSPPYLLLHDALLSQFCHDTFVHPVPKPEI